jgi:hypothetical protein
MSSSTPGMRTRIGRDVLEFPHVDAGHGWLFFALPPAEVAVHPADDDEHHELYLLCQNLSAVVASLTARGVTCAPVTEARWGTVTRITLPGGGRLGLYAIAAFPLTPVPSPAKRTNGDAPIGGGLPTGDHHREKLPM